MRYLAVYGEARRGPLGSIWHRSRYGSRWHAIFEELLPPAPALCGASTHGSEAQRTWEQVPVPYRCSRCALRAAPELVDPPVDAPVEAVAPAAVLRGGRAGEKEQTRAKPAKFTVA